MVLGHMVDAVAGFTWAYGWTSMLCCFCSHAGMTLPLACYEFVEGVAAS